MERQYPEYWEADVVLRDGGTAHVRPMMPDDADTLLAFYDRVSDRSKYFRFFAPRTTLSERDVQRLTQNDYHDRVSLLAQVGTEMIGMVGYVRVDESGRAAQGESPLAEVAFLIEDGHQRRGLASVLLEHIAAVAWERGIRHFVADVLPENRKMLEVFHAIGYLQQERYEDGVVSLTVDIEPTETFLAVQQAREHRAEARSIQRLLAPQSVAVIGASRRPGTVGNTLLRNLLDADFSGSLYPVNPKVEAVAGVPAYPSVLEIPGPVDVAVVAVPAGAVNQVVVECGRKNVHAVIVISGGFAEQGAEGRVRQARLVQLARTHGMRLVGPNCLGILYTDPQVRLNASLSPIMPERGRIGLFAQSGALGIAILDTTVQRGLGLSSFVSAGNRADVSGNDLLQFWEEHPDTDVILLYLESLGNPRKFTRLVRRVSRSKPVVVVKSGRHARGVPRGHALAALSLSDDAVDAVFNQTGVIRVPTVAEMFDVAQLLAYQPLPAGDRVAILGNSDALGVLAYDACLSAGLNPREPVDLLTTATGEDFSAALAQALDDPESDAVIVGFIPPLTTTEQAVAQEIGTLAATAAKPVLATYLGLKGLPAELQRLEDGVPARGSVPSYRAPEDAVRALARVVRYAQWRARPQGVVPDFEDVDRDAARAFAAARLGPGRETVTLTPDEVRELLGYYGIAVWPEMPVADEDAAAAAARELGYPVALKSMTEQFRDRPDLGGVRLGIAAEPALRKSFAAMADRFGGAETAQLVVQAMAPQGCPVVVGVTDDPSFGPLMSFGLSGPATELLGDRAYRILPAGDAEVAELVRSVKAAPILFGYRGVEPVDVAALEQLLLRVARLADDLPEIAELQFTPVEVAVEGLAVLHAEIRLVLPAARTGWGPRSLRPAN